jgi:hypothetical protein
MQTNSPIKISLPVAGSFHIAAQCFAGQDTILNTDASRYN